MRALVTGGAGFIGSYLSEELLRRDIKVSIIDNLFRGKLENIKNILDENNKFYNIDLSDNSNIKEVEEIINIERPEIIYHYAAINGTQYFYDLPQMVLEKNTLMTLNLMQSISNVVIKDVKYKPKIVYASSSEVYGEPLNLPTNESDITYINVYENRDSYALSKLNGEFLIKLYSEKLNLKFLLYRLFNVYGPRMVGTKYGQVIPEFFNRLVEGEYPLKIYGDGSHKRSFCYIEDNVFISVEISLKAENDVINIGNPYEISINKLAEEIMIKMNLIPKVEFLTERSGDHKRRCPDISKIISYIGEYKFIDLNKGLDIILEGINFKKKNNEDS
jgi:UDP-glucuronate decarboxylase